MLIFFRKIFFSLSLELLDIWQTHDVFVNLLEYLRDGTTFIFWQPMSLIEFVSISNMGVANRDVLVLATIR